MSITRNPSCLAFASWLRRMLLLAAGLYALAVGIGVMAVLGPQGGLENTMPARSILYPLFVALGPFTGYAGAGFGVDALRFPPVPSALLALGSLVLLLLARFMVRWRTAAWLLGVVCFAWCVVWLGAGLVVVLSVAEL